MARKIGLLTVLIAALSGCAVVDRDGYQQALAGEQLEACKDWGGDWRNEAPDIQRGASKDAVICANGGPQGKQVSSDGYEVWRWHYGTHDELTQTATFRGGKLVRFTSYE